jgi:phosphoglycerate dehydrogenase-like enzyme
MILAGRTLGLLGLGRIGKRMAEYGKAFGMDVIAWSENLTAEAAAAVGVRRVEKDELFAEADVVSIHLVLSERSRGLVTARELRLMKPTAYLINTSRGALIDQDALARALADGEIAGAGLDVLTPEPPPPDLALLSAPNVIVTPHVGFYSDTAIRELQTDAIANVISVLNGNVPENVVNPTVLESDGLRMRLARARG